ncbi:(2Fe-2S)-binding protein [Conchiformibius steedae DSM 2580]|uniref:Bacterioferritin-associated ferredoxin n=1 Tax=Conchiformibius steedae DSM 2580 TaxID=1121352 RepID=A0AAE9HV48_9NEIS|nr:(2Fe-2S)-binding protein [Conchiformibius steedae]QMT33842.1 (2Fe-2S)-binding protein [Conchiformibius steedae]URD68503.1 (2Fe-2S)-binding protein [Conchiformibius steedae DSM 2580]
MYVCICNAVTDRQIQDTVAAGASSLNDLQDSLGVASCCGCCADLASSFLNAANGAGQNVNHISCAEAA